MKEPRCTIYGIGVLPDDKHVIVDVKRKVGSEYDEEY